jgi:hypothetical protein
MNIKKILLYSILGIVLIAIGFVAYTMLTTRSHSPAAQMEFKDGDFELTINYCRPFKKDRLIFGDKSEDALVPFGEYWRTGANEATEIEFNRDIQFNGKRLNAGRYSLYTFPGKDIWIVGINSDKDKWGYGEPDYDQDVLRTEIPVHKKTQITEQFTISGEKQGKNTMDVVLSWDQTQIIIPITY